MVGTWWRAVWGAIRDLSAMKLQTEPLKGVIVTASNSVTAMRSARPKRLTAGFRPCEMCRVSSRFLPTLRETGPGSSPDSFTQLQAAPSEADEEMARPFALSTFSTLPPRRSRLGFWGTRPLPSGLKAESGRR